MPKRANLFLSTEIETDSGSIFGPVSALRRLRGPELSPGDREVRSIERAAADWLDSIELGAGGWGLGLGQLGIPPTQDDVITMKTN